MKKYSGNGSRKTTNTVAGKFEVKEDVLFLPAQGSISSMFYVQLLHLQIPKA